MIESLTGWLRQLILLLVGANLVGMVLPGGSLRRYVDVVLGLVILATILSPLFGWLGGDLERSIEEALAAYEEQLTGSSVAALSSARADGTAWRAQETRRLYQERLAAAMRRDLKEHFGLRVATVEVELAEADGGAEGPWSPAGVRIGLAGDVGTEAGGEDGIGGEADGRVRVTVQPIEPIRIGTGGVPRAAAGTTAGRAAGDPAGAPGDGVDPELGLRVRRWLADRYGVPAERVWLSVR